MSDRLIKKYSLTYFINSYFFELFRVVYHFPYDIQSFVLKFPTFYIYWSTLFHFIHSVLIIILDTIYHSGMLKYLFFIRIDVYLPVSRTCLSIEPFFMYWLCKTLNNKV